MNEAIAFAPMKKSSDKFKEHKAKVEENYVNYGKAIRSNVAPDVKTAKDHEDAVDKMKKAVMASLYHSIMLKDDKVRHQFCPSGDTSWCQVQKAW